MRDVGAVERRVLAVLLEVARVVVAVEQLVRLFLFGSVVVVGSVVVGSAVMDSAVVGAAVVGSAPALPVVRPIRPRPSRSAAR